jgi:hypothetical protein
MVNGCISGMNLHLPEGKKTGFNTMISKDPNSPSGTNYVNTVYVPLEFWFCRNIGLALTINCFTISRS